MGGLKLGHASQSERSGPFPMVSRIFPSKEQGGDTGHFECRVLRIAAGIHIPSAL